MDGSLHYNERVESELYQVGAFEQIYPISQSGAQTFGRVAGFRPGSAIEFPRPPSPKKYLGEQAFAAAAPKAYVPVSTSPQTLFFGPSARFIKSDECSGI